MKPIISVVGRSNSGKTTLLERLIPEIRRRGYSVAVIKHHVSGFDLDREGKDSWRISKAGADAVVLASPGKLALLQNTSGELSPDEIAERYLKDVDIVFTEGFKSLDKPKIELFRADLGEGRIPSTEEPIAFVSNDEKLSGTPSFRNEEISALADFIEKEILGRC
ncbi:MAG: molybdopterin-guanine dinucleotide biosynthesis protein B [bacterium]